MSEVYVNQPLRVTFTCTEDGTPLAGILSARVKCKHPDATEETLTATVGPTVGEIHADFASDDLDASGNWKLQPEVCFDAGNVDWYPGTTVVLEVRKRFT